VSPLDQFYGGLMAVIIATAVVALVAFWQGEP